MVRGMFIGLMAAITFLAWPITAAHAGGMGRGTGGQYMCYIASGESPGGIIKGLTDLDGFISRDVKIGTLRLVCTPVIAGTRPTSNNEPKAANPPDPCTTTSPLEICADHLLCYNIVSSKGDNPNTQITIGDYFFDETTPTIGGAQIFCVGAQLPVSSPSP